MLLQIQWNIPQLEKYRAFRQGVWEQQCPRVDARELNMLPTDKTAVR